MIILPIFADRFRRSEKTCVRDSKKNAFPTEMRERI